MTEHTLSKAHTAITDLLNFTFEYNPKPDALRELFMGLFRVLGPKFGPAVDLGCGILGYKRAFALGDSGAMLGVGGQRSTVLISMNGTACSIVEDWESVAAYFGLHLKGRITRWDGAVDDYSGKHSLHLGVSLYRQGMFSSGGSMPSTTQIGNWMFDDGTGRTLNIGKRKNGKMIRIYEKGRQLGRLWDNWVRWEVEIHNRHRQIPLDVLLRPGDYFVGAYPNALGWVQKEMARVKTIRLQSQISYEHLAEYASIAYGSLLNVMQKVEGSPEEAFKKLVRGGRPKRLRPSTAEEMTRVLDPASDFSSKAHPAANSTEDAFSLLTKRDLPR